MNNNVYFVTYECGCQGMNKACVNCQGTGVIRDEGEPVAQVRPEQD